MQCSDPGEKKASDILAKRLGKNRYWCLTDYIKITRTDGRGEDYGDLTVTDNTEVTKIPSGCSIWVESVRGGNKILLRDTLVKWVTYNDVLAGHWGYLKQYECAFTGPDKTNEEINYWCRKRRVKVRNWF